MIDGLKPYAEYKDSGQDWLGNVPAHWTLAPGHSALRERKESNRGLKKKTVLSLSYGRIKVKPIEKQTGLVPESYETYQIVEPGNIVIRGTDLQNDKTSLRIGLACDSGIITSAYLCFAARNTVTPEYAYQMLNVFDLTKAIYRYGSGLRQNLEAGDIKRLPIFLPPLDEQAAIVRFLNHANRKIDGFIRAKRKLIALLNEQKQAIIHRAVTRGIDPDVSLKPSGIEWLGEIPSHWDLRPFVRSVIEKADYRGATPEKVEDGIFLVTAKNIRKGWIDYESSKEYVRKCDYATIMRRGLPKVGDILLTTEAPLGHVALIDDESIALAQRIIRFRPDPELLRSDFALYSMNSRYFQCQLAERGTGSTAVGIKASKLPQLRIALPPVAEQEQIVLRTDSDCKPLESAIVRAEREITLMQEYRTRLTTDIVTGKLDVRAAAAALPEIVDAAADEPVADELTDEPEYEDA